MPFVVIARYRSISGASPFSWRKEAKAEIVRDGSQRSRAPQFETRADVVAVDASNFFWSCDTRVLSVCTNCPDRAGTSHVIVRALAAPPQTTLRVRLRRPPSYSTVIYSHSHTHDGWRRQDSIPEACLVTGRWLVRTTAQLEDKHGSLRSNHSRRYRYAVEVERRKRGQISYARARSLLPEQKVS